MALRLQILGPLRVWRDGVELDPGPRQQAQLLAILLAQVGRPLSTAQLIYLLWGDEAPATAVNVLHKYVGGLRRLLEPNVPRRTQGRYVRRVADGYQLAADSEVADLVEFRTLVREATSGPPHHALDRYIAALGLWQGGPAEGLFQRSDVAVLLASLEDEFFTACVSAAELAVPLGHGARVIPALQLAASRSPFHEPVHAALIAALGAAGRQAEALASYDAIRRRLIDELGIDPGAALRDAHAAVLSQSPTEQHPADGQPPRGTPAEPPVLDAASTRSATSASSNGVVGRTMERGLIIGALDLMAHAGSSVVLVEGEPGSGKTRLLEEASEEASARGALVVWGSCVESGGSPALWPWEQALRGVLADSPSTRERWMATGVGELLDPGSDTAPAVLGTRGQFHLFEQVVSFLQEAAQRRPTVLVLDDLQWADATSLQLLRHVASRLPARSILLCSSRSRAPVPGPDLSRILAGFTRLPGHRRVQLGPLTLDEVADLIRRHTGTDPSPATVADIHDRTSGNPFFVRELSRWLDDNETLDAVPGTGPSLLGVPSTVRDVVRDRMTALEPDTEALLRLAAMVGRDVDVDLLARARGIDVRECLARLQPLHELGLIQAGRGDSLAVGFTHDLVREAVTESTPQQQAVASHLAIANALEHAGETNETVVERLAFHLWSARAIAEPTRTIEALTRAGRRASNKLAFAAADRHLESAAQLARQHGMPEQELYALSLLAVAPRRQAGFGGTTFDLLERAESVARQLGRDVDAAGLLFARLFGAYTFLEWDRAGLVRRLIEHAESSTDPVVHVYGRQAWGLHQWDVGNIAEAYRSFLDNDPKALDGVVSPQSETPVRRDVSGEWPGWRAVMTALHGDPAAAATIIDEWNGSADGYGVTVWAYYTAIIASMAGDPGWVVRTIQRWMTVGTGRTAVQQEVYIRLIWCWARALTGDDPAGMSREAQTLLDDSLVDPPRWGVAYHHALIAEMWLAAGDSRRAEGAIARAEHALDAYGQRYAEGLILLVQARVLEALGAPTVEVRDAARRARDLSVSRGAYLFATRVEQYLPDLVVEHPGPGGRRESPTDE